MDGRGGGKSGPGPERSIPNGGIGWGDDARRVRSCNPPDFVPYFLFNVSFFSPFGSISFFFCYIKSVDILNCSSLFFFIYILEEIRVHKSSIM